MRVFALLSMLTLFACRNKDDSGGGNGGGGDDGGGDDTGAPVDADGDGFPAGEDCDDTTAAAYPGATEACDEIDNNCDGAIDEGLTTTFFTDADADGFGDDALPIEACALPDGAAEFGGDCDDTNAETYPEAAERCDSLDNDCDGTVDEDVLTTWYTDADADGFGDAAAPVESCDPAPGVVADNTDCNDAEPLSFPGNPEVCDGVDNDCEGTADVIDADGDTFQDGACGGDDCNDADAAVNPGAAEVWYDGVDQDCSGTSDFDADGDTVDSIDHGGTDCDDAVATTFPGATDDWYDGVDADCAGNSDYDADADSFDSNAYGGTDCDDAVATTFPGATDAWYDGVDADCAGDNDFDADRDGFDSDAYGGTDCDDALATTFPGATDRWYDGVDADCAGNSDFDRDADGFDSSAYGGTDCADGNRFRFPGARERWYDGIDQDCSGGSDYDADADTYDSSLYGGTDCNDAVATINPGAAEVWYDGVDGDCAGGDDFDADADSFTALAYGGTDCLDTNPAVFPGATDTWYDGVDSDCGGNSDYDRDADGYDSDAYGGTDCADGNPFRSPGRAEIWYDGSDDDCSGGSDYDADSDGFDSDEWGGTDCNDTLDDMNPGLPEVPDDGYDNDCDGVAERGTVAGGYSVDGADYTIRGAVAGDRLGQGDPGIAPAGDVNGDGAEDFIVSAIRNNPGTGAQAGAAYLVNGPITGTFTGRIGTLADATLRGEAAGDLAGRGVTGLGDVDGDGFDDILVAALNNDTGATNAGKAYLVLGPISGTVNLSAADARLWGNSANMVFAEVAPAGDMNNDGRPDFLVGAQADDVAGTDAGAVYLFNSPWTASGSVATLGIRITGANAGDALGASNWSAGDVDGDGFDDFVVGALGVDTGGADAGAVYVVYGPVTSGGSISSLADGVRYGEEAGARIGQQVSVAGAGDTDGDGLDDLIVGSQDDDDGAENAGAAYVLRGPVTGSASLATADAKLLGWTPGDYVGDAVDGPGDIDGDGFDDLLIGSGYADFGATNGGAVYLVRGPVSGTQSLQFAWTTLWTEGAEDRGRGRGIGDVDGDGRPDVAITAQLNDGGGTDAGAAFLFFAAGL